MLPQFQQVLEPNADEHYVELRLRTYRLFVLQTELILIQCVRRREDGRRNYAFECESAERERCAISPRAVVGKFSPFVVASKVQKGVS